ncbi:MAG: ABC transporter substrate-binding protein, partial [Pseudomonadota bacterium]
MNFIQILGVALALTASETASAETREIEHIWGVTRIDAVPERIVSLSFNGADNWLALGVVPLAYRVWYGGDETGLWPWASEVLGDARPVQLRGGIDMEAVARLEPDLIEAMYSGLTLAQYRSLSRFAPVIGPPPGTGEFEAGWDQMIRTFGEIMGREVDAEKIVTGLERSFVATRQAHPGWQGASAVVAIPDGPLILTAEDARLQFLERLGFVPHAPAEALSLGGFFYRLDPEITEPLDADLLLWLDFGGGLEPVRRNPL